MSSESGNEIANVAQLIAQMQVTIEHSAQQTHEKLECSMNIGQQTMRRVDDLQMHLERTSLELFQFNSRLANTETTIEESIQPRLQNIEQQLREISGAMSANATKVGELTRLAMMDTPIVHTLHSNPLTQQPYAGLTSQYNIRPNMCSTYREPQNTFVCTSNASERQVTGNLIDFDEPPVRLSNGEVTFANMTSSASDRDHTNSSSAAVRIKPLPFDGSTSWSDYIMQFEIIANANNWTASAKAAYLAGTLRGPALCVLKNLPATSRTNYQELVCALERRFRESHLQQTSHPMLRARTQNNKEGILDFAADVERLTKLAFRDCGSEPQDRIALHQFLDGIENTSTQELVRMRYPKSLDQAVTFALEVEAAQHATRANRNRTVRSIAEDVICSVGKSVNEGTQTNSPPYRPRPWKNRRPQNSDTKAKSASGNDQQLDKGV